MPTVVVNSNVIHYEEFGQGPALLLLMGLGAPGSLWERHDIVYRQHFRCIRIDNRGAGKSDPINGEITTEDMAKDAVGVMDALGITRFSVAGLSMGGAIAQIIAAQYPERVERCLLTSSWAKCDETGKRVFAMLSDTKQNLSRSAFARLLNIWIYAFSYQNDHAAELNLEELASDMDNSIMPAHHFSAQAKACAMHDATALLAWIKAPTLVTVGDEDIFTPVACSQALHDGIAGSTLKIFPHAGHVHHWEQLEEFNRLTTDFLMGGEVR